MFDFNDRNDWGFQVLRVSNIPSRFRGLELDDLRDYESIKGADPKEVARDWIYRLVHGEIVSGSGQGLLLLGNPGHGKTTLAVATAQFAARAADWGSYGVEEDPLKRPQGTQVYYVSYPELLELAKRQFSNRTTDDEDLMLDRIWGYGDEKNRVKVLVLDDLGREHRTGSGWSESYFDNLLRKRFDLGLPTIVTSNVPRSQWADVYGARMDSFAREAFKFLPIIAPEGDRRV